MKVAEENKLLYTTDNQYTLEDFIISKEFIGKIIKIYPKENSEQSIKVRGINEGIFSDDKILRVSYVKKLDLDLYISKLQKLKDDKFKE